MYPGSYFLFLDFTKGSEKRSIEDFVQWERKSDSFVFPSTGRLKCSLPTTSLFSFLLVLSLECL